MKKHLLQLLLCFIASTPSLILTGGATEIPIANHSFENPMLADGALREGGPVVDWSGEGAFFGIANPANGFFSGTTDALPGQSPIDGFNAAYMNVGSKLMYLVPNVVVQPSTIYVLSLLAGHRIGSPFGNSSMSLWAGSNLLAEGFPNPPEDKFVAASLNYTSPPSGGVIGQPLRIELKAQGAAAQAWFDDIHLSYESWICTPRKARATAQVINGFVVGATLIDGGCGYTNPPLVLIQGGAGSGALAEAIVTNGEVTGIRILDPGSGYTSVPRIVISSPPMAPSVAINVSRVKVIQNVVLGWKYILESSSNNVDWTPTGPAFVADTDPIETEFAVEGARQLYRLRVVP